MILEPGMEQAFSVMMGAAIGRSSPPPKYKYIYIYFSMVQLSSREGRYSTWVFGRTNFDIILVSIVYQLFGTLCVYVCNTKRQQTTKSFFFFSLGACRMLGLIQ